jgi:PEP-CTERM motif
VRRAEKGNANIHYVKRSYKDTYFYKRNYECGKDLAWNWVKWGRGRVSAESALAQRLSKENVMPKVKGAWMMRKMLVFVVALLLFGILGPRICLADTLNSGSLTFQTSNQSMWNTGSAFNFSYNPTLVNIPINFSSSVGPGIGCVLGACAGFDVNSNVSGNVGMNASLNVNGGTVDATMPVNISLGFSNSVANNTPVSITSSALFGTGSLTTASPTASASLGVFANLTGGISADGCIVVACKSGGATFKTSATATLFSVNSQTFPPQTLSLGSNVDLTIGAPYVQTSGTGGPTISAAGSSPFLGLNANITNLAASGLGLPAPSGSIDLPLNIGGLTYNLFSLTAGLSLNTTQAFSLTAQPLVDYSVTTVGSNASSFSSGPMAVGTPYSFSIPTGDTSAVVTPTYMMSALLDNNTGGALSASLGFSALGYSSYGVFKPLGSKGPLVNTSSSFPVANFSVFNNQFALQGWNSFQGNSFQIAATGVPVAPTPEPSSLLLLGVGLLVLAGLIRRTVA